MRDRTKRKIIVEIENLTEAQEIALNDFFATWEQLGSWGSSRWTAFYADGDGDFRPKIRINGLKPQTTELIDRTKLWRDDEYRIDFDSVGWALQAIEDSENPPKKEIERIEEDFMVTHHYMTTNEGGSICTKCGQPYDSMFHIKIDIDEEWEWKGSA